MDKIKEILKKANKLNNFENCFDYKDCAEEFYGNIILVLEEYPENIKLLFGTIPDGGTCPRAFNEWVDKHLNKEEVI